MSLSFPAPPMLRALATAALLLPLTAAGCATAQAPASGPPAQAQVQTDEPFELAVGERLAHGDHTLHFVGVAEDSRCPPDAQCVWAGKASVRVEVDGAPVVLTLPYPGQEASEPSAVAWGDGELAVTALVPGAGADAPDAAPVATFVLR